VAPLIVNADEELATTLLDDELLDALEFVLDALELLELPAPTAIEKSLDAVLFQLSVAVTRMITVESTLGAVTVVVLPVVAESEALPLMTLHA